MKYHKTLKPRLHQDNYNANVSGTNVTSVSRDNWNKNYRETDFKVCPVRRAWSRDDATRSKTPELGDWLGRQYPCLNSWRIQVVKPGKVWWQGPAKRCIEVSKWHTARPNPRWGHSPDGFGPYSYRALQTQGQPLSID